MADIRNLSSTFTKDHTNVEQQHWKAYVYTTEHMRQNLCYRHIHNNYCKLTMEYNSWTTPIHLPWKQSRGPLQWLQRQGVVMRRGKRSSRPEGLLPSKGTPAHTTQGQEKRRYSTMHKHHSFIFCRWSPVLLLPAATPFSRNAEGACSDGSFISNLTQKLL